MRDAGHPNGFTVDWLTPAPPFYTRGSNSQDLALHPLRKVDRRLVPSELGYLVPVFRHAFTNAIGPRIAARKWQDVFKTITTGYAYPWEDIKLKE